MRPIDVATNETVDFVLRSLLPPPLRILEVGCGRGEVASRLQGVGYRVIAIDNEANAIEQARLLGVDARIAQWPFFEGTPFDAILFTRSLHHIAPFADAISHTHQLLLPSGVVLVEDFAYHDIDLPTTEWFYSLVALLKTCQMLVTKEEFLAAFVEWGGDFALWQEYHDPQLHSAPMIRAALKEVFPQVAES